MNVILGWLPWGDEAFPHFCGPLNWGGVRGTQESIAHSAVMAFGVTTLIRMGTQILAHHWQICHWIDQDSIICKNIYIYIWWSVNFVDFIKTPWNLIPLCCNMFCVQGWNFKDIGQKVWQWKLIKNCMSENPISRIWEFCVCVCVCGHSKCQVSNLCNW